MSETDSKKSKTVPAFTSKNFSDYVREQVAKTGKTAAEIVEETFHDGFLTYMVEESGGTAQLNISQLYKKNPATKKLAECIRLRNEFGPVSACVDHLRDSLLGDGVSIVIDDAKNGNQKEMKEYLEELSREVYQDVYTQGLDVLLAILVDNALTVGVSAAEICYGKEDLDFWDYAKLSEEAEKLRRTRRSKIKDYVHIETTEPKWSDLKKITRLKIMANAYKRFKLYRDPVSWEAKYWSVDEAARQDVITRQGVRLHYVLQRDKKQKIPTVYLHPWQVFWLILRRTGEKAWNEMGESVIMPALSTALLAEKIMKAIGEGIYRAGNKKYFIVCGTEKRPWSAPHIRNVIQQLQEASKKNWSTIPMPAGFDVKEIGGQVFEGNTVSEYFLRTLASTMKVPSKVVGVSMKKDEPHYSYRLMKLQLRLAIQHQLFKLHLWCNYGKTKSRQGGSTSPIYVPRPRFRIEALLSITEELDLYKTLLNPANPVRPEVKLEIERSICKLMGWDNVLLPTQDELKEELEEAQKLEEAMLKQKMAGKPKGDQKPDALSTKEQGEPKPQTKERQKERLKGMTKKHPEKGKARTQGSTRKPKA